MDNQIKIKYTCQCCYKEKDKLLIDRTGYYENKILAEDGNFRCKKCKIIKPIENFSLVNKKKFKRRRKCCDDCRKKQLRDAYYKRKQRKLESLK